MFNGKYSTFCYLDAVTHAAADMATRRGRRTQEIFDDARAILFHRPYHWMPVQAMATLSLWSLAQAGDAERAQLEEVCAAAGVPVEEVLVEIRSSPDLFERAEACGVDADPFPNATAAAKVLRRSEAFAALRRDKMSLGADAMMEVGNIYTAALPAWIAAAFEDARDGGVELAGEEIVAIGYGSGDASEAIPLRVVDGWREAAGKIDFRGALDGAIDLEREQYESLHDGHDIDGFDFAPRGDVRVARVGQEVAPEFQDIGIEYYEVVELAAKHARRAAA